MEPVSICRLRTLVIVAGLCVTSLGSVAQQPSQPSDSADELQQLQQKALAEGEAGKNEDAIRDYSRALALAPEWKEGRWNLGNLEYGAGHFAEAADTFQQVVRFAPSLAIAWSLLGLSEFEVKRFDDALAHLEKAEALGIKDDPEVQRVSAYHLALLWIRSNQFERAADLLHQHFGSAALTPQLKTAFGLIALRIPLLPNEIDPSHDGLISLVGEAALGGPDSVSRFSALLKTHPDVPYLHYAFGLALMKNGQPADAAEAFREESQISPQSPLPWIGLSHLGTISPAGSIEYARKAVSIAPSNMQARQALADALERNKQTEEAAQEMRIVAKLNPEPIQPETRIIQRYSRSGLAAGGSAQEIWDRALRKYSSHQYLQAASDLKQWLSTNPENGTALAMLGLCEFDQKDYDNALIHLRRGAELGLSGNTQSLDSAKYTLGILLIHAGEFDQATPILISIRPNGTPDESVIYALGLALLRRPEFPSDQLAPPSLILTAGKIAVDLQQSKYDDALPLFKQLLLQHPAEPFLHYAYGTALMAISEFDDAATQMRLEMKISPKSELPLLRLASIALHQHRPSEAVEQAQQALTLMPQSVEAHYLYGRASLENGDSVTAIRELETASKLSPLNPEIHFNLAKAYARTNQPEKAQQERAEFARLNAAKQSSQ